ncbi:MAG: hypothetical protein R2731_01340 [Nocardioides sp.]
MTSPLVTLPRRLGSSSSSCSSSCSSSAPRSCRSSRGHRPGAQDLQGRDQGLCDDDAKTPSSGRSSRQAEADKQRQQRSDDTPA